MINVILTGILLILSVQTFLFIVFLCKTAAIFREFLLFITPAGENKPSPASEVWTAMAETLIVKAKMTLLGLMSVQSKAEKRVEGDLVEAAVAAKSPVAGMILEALPGLKKLVRRNPALIDAIVNKLAGSGKTGGPSNGNGDFASNLQKYA